MLMIYQPYHNRCAKTLCHLHISGIAVIVPGGILSGEDHLDRGLGLGVEVERERGGVGEGTFHGIPSFVSLAESCAIFVQVSFRYPCW